LETRIRETYGKTFDEIKDQYLGVEVNREEIDRIKKKMESLGQVIWRLRKNMTSFTKIYFYTKRSSRTFKRQRKIGKKVIKKINETTIEKFQKNI
jgi:hypothetical protein